MTDRIKEEIIENLTESCTITEAAQKSGITRGTLCTLIRMDDDFSFAYGVMQLQFVTRLAEELQEKREHAIEFLVEVMNNDAINITARINAAKAIVDFSRRQSEKVSRFVKEKPVGNTPKIRDKKYFLPETYGTEDV